MSWISSAHLIANGHDRARGVGIHLTDANAIIKCLPYPYWGYPFVGLSGVSVNHVIDV
ncbi:hypothetical protein HanIR_Chr14g0704711 [Helianthus annuus]|nr:hypothetical protein HanIR_Chr14g0704711 [Helianthus annuus]